MIIKKPNSAFLPQKTYTYLFRKYHKQNKKISMVYVRLLGDQQNGIFYENITEMAKELKYTARTLKNYISVLKKEGLIYKLDNIYVINMSPQKQILKNDVSEIWKKDQYLYNKYMKAE